MSIAGKSFFYNALIAACHAHGDGVIPCASTGIASILLMSTAGTAHRTFRLPIDISKEFKCQFSPTEYMGEQLREAKLIIIDEVSMLHRDVIKAIDSTLRSVLHFFYIFWYFVNQSSSFFNNFSLINLKIKNNY